MCVGLAKGFNVEVISGLGWTIGLVGGLIIAQEIRNDKKKQALNEYINKREFTLYMIPSIFY